MQYRNMYAYMYMHAYTYAVMYVYISIYIQWTLRYSFKDLYIILFCSTKHSKIHRIGSVCVKRHAYSHHLIYSLFWMKLLLQYYLMHLITNPGEIISYISVNWNQWVKAKQISRTYFVIESSFLDSSRSNFHINYAIPLRVLLVIESWA